MPYFHLPVFFFTFYSGNFLQPVKGLGKLISMNEKGMQQFIDLQPTNHKRSQPFEIIVYPASLDGGTFIRVNNYCRVLPCIGSSGKSSFNRDEN